MIVSFRFLRIRRYFKRNSSKTLVLALTLSLLLAGETSFGGPAEAGPSGKDVAGSGISGPLPATCSSPGAPIPDVDSVSDTISVVNSGLLADLDVYFDVPHTWVGDLEFELQHGNVTATLINRPGHPADFLGCGEDDYDVTVNDEGSDGNIESQCDSNPPAIHGDRIGGDPPGSVLDVFDGLDYGGDWILTIHDRAGGDIGTLVKWCLIPNTDGADHPSDVILPLVLFSSAPSSSPITGGRR